MKTLLIVTLIIISISVYSQKVVSSSGGYFEASGVSLGWTLGEPVIETYSNGNNVLTQGFHQTRLKVTPVFSITDNREIFAYPNPVNELVFVEIKNSAKFNATASLNSLDGKMLKQFNLISENNILDIHEYPNGIYLLKITQGKNHLRTFKLVKMY